MNVWRPKAGEYVQIWDSYAVSSGDNAYIRDHGKFGYIMRESKRSDSFMDGRNVERFLSNIVEGEVFKVIVFEKSGSKTVHVHQDNLRGTNNGKAIED